jgi:Reverse transcriptase (RNA-dependent DNA polymerase)/Aspartyl protease
MALIWACSTDTVYIARRKSIKINLLLHMDQKQAIKKALLDSGATKCFIHPKVVKQLKLWTIKLPKPQKVKNVDGTLNQSGEVKKGVTLIIKHNGRPQKHLFYITNIGEDDIILGYPFLEATNPIVNWTKGELDGMTILITTKAHQEQNQETKVPIWLAKTTMATQFAMEVASSKKREWHDFIPKQYHQFKKVFLESASEWFPEQKKWDHAIDLKEDAPTSLDCRVYPLSPGEKKVQKEFIETNMRLERIWRSKSPYASRFFLICKKDWKYWPVQDYWCLNKWTIPNKYPLPLITDLIHDLAGKKLFSKFDIRWGYNNVCIKKGDEWKEAFKTSKGLFKPTVMFFRLTNSPATFQTMMDNIFQEEIAQGWLKIYMDDMIITTEDDGIFHTQKVNHVLQKLIDHDLFLKPEKCQFHKKEVEYLGVIIGRGKVMMDPVKVKGITEWPTPTTVKEVCSFLGFCNFYHPFFFFWICNCIVQHAYKGKDMLNCLTRETI